jgi:transcriptional regulator with XRE-family HTH domain
MTFALFIAAACGREQHAPGVPVVEIGTSDVRHFVDAWKRIVPSDSACTPLTAYFRDESRGLRAYRRKLGMTQADLCAAIRLHPDGYARLESKLAALDSIATTIRALFATYLTFDPTARAPAVYFVVGADRSAGTTARGSDPIILIGMELNHSVNGLPWTVAHEMAHTQQRYPIFGAMPIRELTIVGCTTAGTSKAVAIARRISGIGWVIVLQSPISSVRPTRSRRCEIS